MARRLVLLQLLTSRLIFFGYALCIFHDVSPDASWQKAATLLPANESEAPEVRAAAWSPDGRQVIAVGQSARIWEAPLWPSSPDWKEVRMLAEVVCEEACAGAADQCIPDTFTAAAWSPSGKRVAFGTTGGRIHVWQYTDSAEDPWRPQGMFKLAECRHVRTLQWSPDSKELAVGFEIAGFKSAGLSKWNLGEESAKWQEMVLDAKTMDWICRGPRCFETTDALWSPDMRRLAFAYHGGAEVLSTGSTPNDNEPTAMLELENLKVLSWSSDGQRLAGGSRGGEVRIWRTLRHVNSSTEASIHYDGGVGSLAFSTDRTKLAVGGSSGTLQIWYDLGGGSEQDGASSWRRAGELLGANRRGAVVHTVAFSPDGNRLLFGGVGTVCERPEAWWTDLLARIGAWVLYFALCCWISVALALAYQMCKGLLKAAFRKLDCTATCAMVLCLLLVPGTVWFTLSCIMGGMFAWYSTLMFLPGVLHLPPVLVGHGLLALQSFAIYLFMAACHVFVWLRKAFQVFRFCIGLGPQHLHNAASLAFRDSPTLGLSLLGDAPKTAEGSTPQACAAELLKIVNNEAQGFFPRDYYDKLGRVIEEERSLISICDIVRFLWCYLRSLCDVFPGSLRRRRWLEQELQRVRELRETEKRPEQRNRFQLVADQFAWYRSHDLFLVDVMAYLNVHYGPHGAVGLWPILDAALETLPRLIFKPLWIPPKRREDDLESRRCILSGLAAHRDDPEAQLVHRLVRQTTHEADAAATVQHYEFSAAGSDTESQHG